MPVILPKKFEKITSIEEYARATKYLVDNKCELTGVIGGNQSHHCFDKSTYPDRALDLENCLVMSGYLHIELFHKRFMGGADKSTTPQDLIRWIATLPDSTASKERKARAIKKLKALINKYKNNKTVSSKTEHTHQTEKIKYIEKPPKKRTQNGNHIHTKSKGRYGAKEKDQAHDDLRSAKKQLKKIQTSHKLLKIFVAFGIGVLIVFIISIFWKKQYVEYQDGDYTYMYIGDQKIWFDHFGVQMDEEPIQKDTPQLGGKNQKW